MDLTTISSGEPILIIQSIKKGGDSMSLHCTLEEVLPSYVIMYAADISAVRQLEVVIFFFFFSSILLLYCLK